MNTFLCKQEVDAVHSTCSDSVWMNGGVPAHLVCFPRVRQRLAEHLYLTPLFEGLCMHGSSFLASCRKEMLMLEHSWTH